MNITLLDGRVLAKADISFDPASQRFYRDTEEITRLISAKDKAANFAGYDQEKTNELYYSDKYFRETGSLPPETGSTSTVNIFAENLLTKPLDAPLEALDKGVKQIFDSSGVKTIATVVLVAGIVVAGYYLTKK